MDKWNGMTEPLGIGDAVRIVRSEIVPEHMGIVTEVVMILPAGTMVIHNKSKRRYQLKEMGYVVRNPPDSSWGRNRLYKLPPDFFTTLEEGEAGAPTNRKRLQKVD
jgi:hypothetical protein